MSSILTSIAPVNLTNGVATQILSTKIYASSVICYADNLNTGNIYMGGPTVSVTNGIPISKNMSNSLAYDLVWGANGKIDLSSIYFDTDTSGNKVRVVYVPWGQG